MEIGNSKSVAEREDEGTLVHVRDESGELQFYGDGGEKKPVTIRVAGSYSKTFRKAKERQREKNLKRGRAMFTAEGLAKQELEVIAACVISWDGFTSDSRPFIHSQDNAVMLLDSAPWIREQVEEAMSDHQSFSTAPSSS